MESLDVIMITDSSDNDDDDDSSQQQQQQQKSPITSQRNLFQAMMKVFILVLSFHGFTLIRVLIYVVFSVTFANKYFVM